MSTAAARQKSGGSLKKAPPPKSADDTLLRLANWLREPKKSGVTTREAVQYERRVEYFKGTKLVDALLSDKYKQANRGFPAVKNRDGAVALANRLMGAQFFHRSQRVFISTRRWELEMHQGPFEEDGLYTWMHEGSKTRLYLLCGLTLAGALLLCMVQIWPLWMKIGLWWCSVTFLTTFSALCIVRLLLFCAMFVIGFRGIWLFPNLFDDNQTFAGSFVPIMGKAEPVVVADEYDSDDDELRRIRKKKNDGAADADGGGAAAEGESAGGGGKKRRAGDEEPAFQFGLVNIAFLGVVGVIACWNMGFFDGENVPDFVAKHDDLTYYFPSIAAPEPANSTAEGGALDEEGNPLPRAEGEDAADPFAAPVEEDVRY